MWNLFKKKSKNKGKQKEEFQQNHVSPTGGVAKNTGGGLLSLKEIPQPEQAKFEDANSWKPEHQVLMYCMNGQDNVPTRIKLENNFAYYISQNRSPGHKDQGQDCMTNASHGNWEIHLLCDGHDKAGHMVALGVCQQLPKILLRRITERNEANPGSENDQVSDDLVNEAFDETARVVCWTKDGITVGLWVKVFDGQWADKPGFIKETNGLDKVKVAIIDENGYHLPSIDKTSLRRPRYTGGCTCLCLIRNKVTKECKVAVSGDSRMLILPTMGVNDAVLLKQPGLDDENPPPEGLITPAHNVFNEDEKERLEEGFAGQYEFDGNFLVNPITKFAIQPTRGFGDFDMFGTGYTHRPEITKTFKLEPNGLILSASDGLFDHHVWADEEIVSCLDKFVEDGLTNVQIIDRMYRETLERSLEGGYVDDISIFVFREDSEADKPEPVAVPEKPPVDITPDEKLPTDKTTKQSKKTRKNRYTIDRGAAAFTDVNKLIEERRKQQAAEEEKQKVGEIVGEDVKLKDDVGGLIDNMAKSHKVIDQVDSSRVLEDKENEGI